MNKPAIGDLFVNPRGKHYVVFAMHPHDNQRVLVECLEDKTKDSMAWAIAIPANGWQYKSKEKSYA